MCVCARVRTRACVFASAYTPLCHFQLVTVRFKTLCVTKAFGKAAQSLAWIFNNEVSWQLEQVREGGWTKGGACMLWRNCGFGGGREGRWNWMKPVSCGFIQTVLCTLQKGWGGGTESQTDVKVNNYEGDLGNVSVRGLKLILVRFGGIEGKKWKTKWKLRDSLMDLFFS